MLQMTSRFDGLPDFLLRRLKENEFVKGKTHHPNNIQLSINLKLHYNKIIIWPALCACVCVRVFAASLRDLMAAQTHAHNAHTRENERGEKLFSCDQRNISWWTFQQYKISLWAKPYRVCKIGVQVAHFEWWTLQKQMHFSSKMYLFERICVCVCAAFVTNEKTFNNITFTTIKMIFEHSELCSFLSFSFTL